MNTLRELHISRNKCYKKKSQLILEVVHQLQLRKSMNSDVENLFRDDEKKEDGDDENKKL